MKLAIKFTILVIILTWACLSYAKNIDSIFHLLKTKNCYRIEFVQINNFLGKKEEYRGLLIKNSRSIEIVYNTNPPFIVKTENDYILLGYKGEKPRVYRKNQIPNPILGLLLNLDKLDSFFNIYSCQNSNCTLIPKAYLRRSIKLVRIYIGPQFVKEIFLKGKGRENTVRVLIKHFFLQSCKAAIVNNTKSFSEYP